MTEDRRSLRKRQEIIVAIVWIGGGILGTYFAIEDWGWSIYGTALVWPVTALLGFGCAWLITGEKFNRR